MRCQLILFLLLSQAWGAVTLTQHNKVASAANSVSATLSGLTSTTGSVCVVGTNTNTTRTVSTVTDNIGNTYVGVSGATATNFTNNTTEIWRTFSCGAGVTSITVTWSGSAAVFDKEIFFFEVTGCTSCADDTSGHTNNGSGVSNVYTGPSITTTGTSGFSAAVIALGSSIDQNPNSGNEYSSGGDISSNGNAAASLIYSTAASHQPVWHGTGASSNFCASVAAFKASAAAAASLTPAHGDSF